MAGTDVLTLDLATLRLRHLFPARGWRFVAADPEGRTVLALDAAKKPHRGMAE
jgi:hypothetical protein